jgi:hypothetical protein
MRMGSIIGAMLASSFGVGLAAAPDFVDLPSSILSPTGSKAGRSHSTGTRTRRRWKRTRAAGITKRARR